jgi:hypothetical protein
MIFIRNLLGYFIAGLCAMYLWGKVVDLLNIGIIGNWIAAVVIVGPLWYINHHVGLIKNSDESAFVDMAVGIGFAGIFKGLFLGAGWSGFVQTLPTLILVIAGGSFGGYLATVVEKIRKIDE